MGFVWAYEAFLCVDCDKIECLTKEDKAGGSKKERSKDKKRAEQGRECSEHTSIYKILQSCSIFSSLFTSVCLESIFHWTEMFWKQYYLAQNSSTSYLEKFSCMCQKRFHLKKKQSPKCSARTLSLETSVTEDGRNVNQNEYASE